MCPWGATYVVSLAILAVLAAPAATRAFNDPASFATPVLEGGGGGRFFTGSPADGYTCKTCHMGGQPPDVDVTGLPARYVPGATYELSVTWPADIGDVGALLELTDEHGAGAGNLASPPPAAVTDEELCEPRSQHVLAASLLDTEHGRAIAGVGACGASALRVQWTAPKASVGRVWLAGGVVVSNQQGDVEGDGVTTFVASAPPFGEQPASAQDHGCSVGRSSRGASAWSLGAFALGLLLIRTRRRRRALLWLCATASLMACQRESLLDPGPPRSEGPVALHAGGAVSAWDAGEPALDGGPGSEPLVDADAAEDDADHDMDAQEPARPALQLRVTTLPQDGQFAPKNIGAVWIEDSDGKWMKTLALWATVTLRYLSQYVQANRAGNTVDAVTSATFTAHREHVVSWDLSDSDGSMVPDGSYHVLLEVTDHNGPGQLMDLEFVKGSDPQTIAPADTPAFMDVELLYAGE